MHVLSLSLLHYYCYYYYYREGKLKVGDRVLAANGVSLMQRTLCQALNFLRDVPDDEVAFLVEYDVSVLGENVIPSSSVSDVGGQTCPIVLRQLS